MMRIICVAVLCAVLCACTSADHGTAEEMMAGWASNSSGTMGTSSMSVASSSSATVSSSLAPSSSSAGCTNTYGTNSVTDCRDSTNYKTVVIGSQTWMEQNLNYATATGSWCYGAVTSNCTTYGRLYDYETALTVCPSGWHLPDTTDWSILETTAGGTVTAGTKLKAKTGWVSGNGTDDYGFSALPGGNYNGSFISVGDNGYWWAATANGSSSAWYRGMSYGYAYVLSVNFYQAGGFSVRCLKDSTVALSSSSVAPSSSSAGCTNTYGTNTVTDCRDNTTYKTVVIGTQTWMAENLNFTSTTGSLCYNGVATNCNTYGRLYDYVTSLTACPSGWHLPDTTAWNILEAAVGGTATAGTKLKANSALWSTNSGTDDFGFSALPGGYYLGTTFSGVGSDGDWWTATPYGSSDAYYRGMYFGYARVLRSYGQSYGFSVRCLKDN